jgi:hypothetical protein
MGELREVESDTGLRFEYRMTSREALRSAESSLWIGVGLLFLGFDISTNHKSALSLYFFAALFLVVGLVSLAQWRWSTWVIEDGYVTRVRPAGSPKKLNLTELARIRIMSRWCSVRDRQRISLLLPAPMLQHGGVVRMIVSGVRSSQLHGQVDIDAATALLVSASEDAVGEIQAGLTVGAHSRGFSPVINRVLNLWMALIGGVIVLTFLFVAIANRVC